MKGTPFSHAGNALLWQGAQHFGVKAIFFIRLLILARLLSPDDFGLLAISSVVIDLLLRITNFGMIPALVQRGQADEEHYDVAWTVGILRGLAITGITFLAAPFVAQLFAEPRATDIIRVLAVRPLIDALASIRLAGLTRDLQFRPLAWIELVKALANTVLAVVLAQWLGVWSLVVGTLAGSFAYLIVSYIVAPYRPRFSFNFYAARSLIKFGQWVFLTSLVVMLGQSMLRLVIARQLGSTDLGLYYLAASLAFFPYEIASQVAGQVAFPLYSRLQSDVRQVSLAFRSILTSLSALLFPICALLIALAPSLVENVLGPNWYGTAPIIRVLALASVIDILGDTIVPILQGTGWPNRVLVMEAIQSFVLISLAWFLTARYGVIGSAMAWIPALVLAQVAGIIFLRQILPRPFAGLAAPIAVIAVVSFVASLIAILLDSVITGIFGIIFISTISLVLVGVLLWILERRFTLGISEGLIRAYPRIASLIGFSSSENSLIGR